MEKINRLREELREEMRSFLKNIINESVIEKFNSMSTDELYELCHSLSSLKKEPRPKPFVIYTDGGYSMKNKVGAGAYVIIQDGKEIKRGGIKLQNATNNIAEITAIQIAMMQMPKNAEVTVRSDSQYAIGVLSKNWNATKNVELIAEVKSLISKKNLSIIFEWVHGHSGNKYNEICDKLCDEYAGCDLNAEYAKFKKK